MIERVSVDEVKACGFKPEPHTVAFDGADEWFAYRVGENIAAVLGVSDRHGGKYISSCYTAPEYRRRGLQSMLVLYVCELYPNCKKIAHCLDSSKHIFEQCGFQHYRTVYYKYGTQYFMKREAV